jgi:hypothetical protein
VALGTLAASGFFTPGDVKNEALLLHSERLALGDALAYREDAAPQDLLASWRAFIDDEKDFYGRAQSFFYFVDFADNASRDQVLALETRFNDLRLAVTSLAADPSSGDSASTLAVIPVFSDASTRETHSVLAEKGGPASEVAGVVGGALNKVESLGAGVIVSALLVIAAVGTVVVLVARSGAVKVGV